MNMKVTSLINDHGSSKASEEGMTYTVTHTGVVPLSSDTTSSHAEDESAEYTTTGETETSDITHLTDDVSAVISSHPATVYCPDDETKTECEEENPKDKDTVNKMLKHNVPREQTLRTWINLIEVAEDQEMDEMAQSFAGTVADIVEWWRTHSKDGNPISHQVDFGVGSPITLLMVLALLPERYQEIICIEDLGRSPSNDGENMSWLHEQTTELLVRLSINPDPASVFFGQGVASMVRDGVDEGWRAITGRSWLEDQIHLQSSNELEPDQYRFPPDTEKIVFLFNPTEIHWTVIEVAIDNDAWTYTLYNSLSQDETGPTWKACQKQLPLLEQLICRASGFAEPSTRQIVTANSAQQENMYDCGPFAIYNAVELLEGRIPCTAVDPEELRLKYLKLIRDALYVSDQGLDVAAFKTYMRRVCVDYLP